LGTARYDKYDPISGGFRAPLNAAMAYTPSNEATNDVGKVWAVGLTASGRVVKGAGATGVIGVLVVNQAMAAGETVDVMTAGEIADFTLHDGNAAAAGTVYYGVPGDGTLSSTATSNVRLGHTVEASRLVVRVGNVGTGA
jgi:hypothetical protein